MDDQEAILNHLVQQDIEIDNKDIDIDRDRDSTNATTNLKNHFSLNDKDNSKNEDLQRGDETMTKDANSQQLNYDEIEMELTEN